MTNGAGNMKIIISRKSKQPTKQEKPGQPPPKQRGIEPLGWVKSSLSYANGNCVEIAELPDKTIAMRTNTDISGPVMKIPPGEWHAFINGVRNGEFDYRGRQ
jgi:hypothetical protein